MNKGNQATTRAISWRFIDQPGAARFQVSKRSLNVLHLNRNVMNSRAALLQKLCHRRTGAQGFQQLDVCITHSKHSHADALFGYVLVEVNLQAERIAPERKRIFELTRGNSDVSN